MYEGPSNSFEEEQTPIPTLEEVRGVFERLKIGGYKTIRQLEDEQGLYLLDATVSGEDGDAEYSYMRAGRYPEGQASATAIHVTFFSKEGVPVGGHSVAKYIGGDWEVTP
ncbi:MAG: hypothetical protein A2Y84_01375 [Candidatus Colwellbacteria bacterium RBG_13_48_8]|uniref:Uncharacterized protein n=1 Tax=Candidatus Colwellbacteria bacterium RBG_13_48_8 TaxID=1797685 RepID=A0A1G1YWF9_9BACT|nr:MAG: hypothetical protein A2Y84_01375 [Candidatus Colwellbacteria bacterium RBG_13_48_8]